ncbi:MAG: hypothetical protein ACPG4U_10105 [Pseudomonadales bacterium]
MKHWDIESTDIQSDLLPQGLQELCQVIGLKATLNLAKAYPGVTLYIPAVPVQGHAIANVVGLDAFQKLVHVYQQETLRIPKLDAAIRQVKHKAVINLKQHGESNRNIALELGYTQRYVEMLVSAQRAESQIDMFED